MNDTPDPTKHNVSISQYADDMGLWTHARRHKAIAAIQYRLAKVLGELEEWCADWRVKLNAGKLQLLALTRGPVQQYDLKLFGVPISDSPSAKLLGITLDRRLNFSQHTKEVQKKATRRLYLMKMLEERNGAPANPHC